MCDSNSAGDYVRLDRQAELIGKATRLLPFHVENMKFKTILNIGCGSGYWTLAIAANRPEAQMLGIDVRRDLINYVNARARIQHLNATSASDVLSVLTGRDNFLFKKESLNILHVGERRMARDCTFNRIGSLPDIWE